MSVIAIEPEVLDSIVVRIESALASVKRGWEAGTGAPGSATQKARLLDHCVISD
jgi:hypothetical protein